MAPTSTTAPSAQYALYSSIHHKLGTNPGMELDDIRRLLDELQTLAAEPTDVTYEEIDAGGVPAILVTPFRAAADRMIVHTHGGGMVANSAATHRKFAAHLAKAAGTRALVVDYRRAPEHQFPAQIEDTVTALRWLRGQGIAPEHMATAGDSAGANLAITAVLKLRDLGEPLPAAVIAFSPWIDMEHVGQTFTTNAHTDALLSREASEMTAGLYLGQTSRTDPLANPLYADLQGFPPVFVTAGSLEVLLDSAERLVERARAAGVDTTYECAPDQQHVHTLMAGRSPEADATIAHAGRWLRPLLGLDEKGQ